jgi:hypothetical protein
VEQASQARSQRQQLQALTVTPSVSNSLADLNGQFTPAIFIKGPNSRFKSLPPCRDPVPICPMGQASPSALAQTTHRPAELTLPEICTRIMAAADIPN